MKLLSIGILAALATAGSAWAGDVTVTVSGVQPNRGGKVYAALQTRDQFMQHAAARGASADPTGPTLTFKLADVPPGDYAISILHDTNGNRQMDTAPSGIPLEGWAIPGGEHLNHTPTFDEVKVTIPASGASYSATMVYMDGKIPGQ